MVKLSRTSLGFLAFSTLTVFAGFKVSIASMTFIALAGGMAAKGLARGLARGFGTMTFLPGVLPAGFLAGAGLAAVVFLIFLVVLDTGQAAERETFFVVAMKVPFI